MKKIKTTAQIERDMNLLIDWGFNVSQGIECAEIGGHQFDLSAVRIERENVMSYVLAYSYRKGVTEGQSIIKTKFKELLID